MHNGKEKSWGKLATYFSFWETSLICLFFICALFLSFVCLSFSCFTLSLSIIACFAPFIDFDLSLYLSSSPLSFCCLHFSLSLTFSLSSSLLFHFCYYCNNWSTSLQSVRLATFFGRPVQFCTLQLSTQHSTCPLCCSVLFLLFAMMRISPKSLRPARTKWRTKCGGRRTGEGYVKMVSVQWRVLVARGLSWLLFLISRSSTVYQCVMTIVRTVCTVPALKKSVKRWTEQ